MSEKERQIIEVGMKLFASKGFSTTSIQEIATESGISKGAFYLHFKSKDDLLLAILQHHFDMIHRAFAEQTAHVTDTRKKFTRELIALYSHFITHRELLVMLAKEQAIPRNETIKQLLFEAQMQSHQNYRQHIVNIYGKEIEPYSWDLTIILEGIINSYMGVVLFSQHEFEIEDLTRFILNRLDSLVKDIRLDTPFLSKDKADAIMSNFLCPNQPSLQNVLKDLEEEIEKLGVEELVITLQVLKEEIGKDKPRVPVIQGMLSNFNEFPSLVIYQSYLADHYVTK